MLASSTPISSSSSLRSTRKARLVSVVVPFNEAASALDRLAERDLTARMTGDYKGDFDNIKVSFNKAAGNLDDAASLRRLAGRLAVHAPAIGAVPPVPTRSG